MSNIKLLQIYLTSDICHWNLDNATKNISIMQYHGFYGIEYKWHSRCVNKGFVGNNHKVARISFVVICISAALEKLIAFTALVNNNSVLIFWLWLKCRGIVFCYLCENIEFLAIPRLSILQIAISVSYKNRFHAMNVVKTE